MDLTTSTLNVENKLDRSSASSILLSFSDSVSAKNVLEEATGVDAAGVDAAIKRRAAAASEQRSLSGRGEGAGGMPWLARRRVFASSPISAA